MHFKCPVTLPVDFCKLNQKGLSFPSSLLSITHRPLIFTLLDRLWA